LRAGEIAKYDDVTHFLWNSDGKLIGNANLQYSIPVDWDGDGIKEIYYPNGEIKKYNGPTLARLAPGGLFAADLFGDSREEIVFAPGGGKVSIAVNTEIMEAPPRITRLADRQYKNDLSRSAVDTFVPINESGYIPGRTVNK
jgi:hypothetical protein